MPLPHVPPPPPEYDANAVAVVESIERTVLRLRPDRQGEIIAILNAIECHIEEGQGDPRVLAHLTDALVAMGAIASPLTKTCRWPPGSGEIRRVLVHVEGPRVGSLPSA
jgi:hypothetical protein